VLLEIQTKKQGEKKNKYLMTLYKCNSNLFVCE